MNNIELNAILFYADFLSLKEISRPVTDNCKYFYIHGFPINSAFILDLEPCYEEDNPFLLQAMAEYLIIRDKYGEDGVNSFIEDICSIRACGSVDAKRMLNCIHQYSTKKERKLAFSNYNEWKNNLTYTHITINEDGDSLEKECSKYVYHAERMLGKRRMVKGL